MSEKNCWRLEWNWFPVILRRGKQKEEKGDYFELFWRSYIQFVKSGGGGVYWPLQTTQQIYDEGVWRCKYTNQILLRFCCFSLSVFMFMLLYLLWFCLLDFWNYLYNLYDIVIYKPVWQTHLNSCLYLVFNTILQ